MTKLRQPAPEFTIDPDGNRLAHLPLAHTSERATLYADDYERVVADGYSPCWSFASTGGRQKYVLVNARSPNNAPRSFTVARLVAEAGKGQLVSYADGDRLNLRRENLLLHEGRAKIAAACVLPRSRGVLLAAQERAQAPSATQGTSPIPQPPRGPYAPSVRDTCALASRERQTAEVSREGFAHA